MLFIHILMLFYHIQKDASKRPNMNDQKFEKLGFIKISFFFLSHLPKKLGGK